jgi:eukaryotic-like serine/threonine-protein kinase
MSTKNSKRDNDSSSHSEMLLGLLIAVLLVALGACVPVSIQILSLTPTLPPPIATPTPWLGSTLVSPADGMIVFFIPSGNFIMGSETGLTDEQPAHTVYLDAFWIDQTEVTNAMYNRCVQSGTCKQPSDTTYFTDPDYSDNPVVFVSWNDAKAYCSFADRRLPTEAEWEKAASWDPVKNEKRVYPWGNDFDCKKGNFDDEIQLDSFVVRGGPNCDGYDRTSPVGRFPSGASPYDILDMGGNTWEWVNDAFIETDPFGDRENYYATSPASNPQGVDPSLTRYRVLRGGSWNLNFGLGRTAYRLWFGLDDSYDFTGFRCASSN